MRIVALLSWWDENPAWLARCVTGIARFADHLVAVDGAYATIPGAAACPQSPGCQADAITAAADSHNIGLTLHRPQTPWAGDEVEKRTFMFQLAALNTDPGDWLYVVDADEIVAEVPGSLRDQLHQAASEGVEAGLVGLDELPHRGCFPTRRFFQADPTLRVEGAHYVYAAGHGDQYRLLSAADGHPLLVPAVLVGGFRFEHWTNHRDAARREIQHAYYERRNMLHLEGETVHA